MITPKEIECCGMPARGYGRMDLVESQARHNITVFEQLNVDTIVTDCAACGSQLKEYGTLLKGDATGLSAPPASVGRCATSASFFADPFA